MTALAASSPILVDPPLCFWHGKRDCVERASVVVVYGDDRMGLTSKPMCRTHAGKAIKHRNAAAVLPLGHSVRKPLYESAS